MKMLHSRWMSVSGEVQQRYNRGATEVQYAKDERVRSVEQRCAKQ